jgi:hypothetical protein
MSSMRPIDALSENDLNFKHSVKCEDVYLWYHIVTCKVTIVRVWGANSIYRTLTVKVTGTLRLAVYRK